MFYPSDNAIRHLCNALSALRVPTALLENHGLIGSDKYIDYDEDVPHLRKASWLELKHEIERARNVDSEQLRNLCCELLRRKNDEDWYYEHPLDSCSTATYLDPLTQFEGQLLDDGYKLSNDGLAIVELKPVPSIAQLADEALFKTLRSSAFDQRHNVLELVLQAQACLRDDRYDECLMKLRSALQRCLEAIVSELVARQGEVPPTFKYDREVREYLEKHGFFTREERRGFDGIYGLLSSGPHGRGDKNRSLLGYAACIMACNYAITKHFSVKNAGGAQT